MSVVIRQVPATSLDTVGTQLREAFLRARDAIESGDAVVLVVDAPDLLGQGSVEDAAVAAGLLGLMRALAFEGAASQWRVNLIAVERGANAPADLMAIAGESESLRGQVLNASSGHIGKVIP